MIEYDREADQIDTEVAVGNFTSGIIRSEAEIRASREAVIGLGEDKLPLFVKA
jgi:hypothetical protein